jgi:hypothetical protein
MGIKATHSNLQTPSTSPTGLHSTMISGFVLTCGLGQFGVDHIRTLIMETVSFRNVGLLTHNVSVHPLFIYKLCVHVIPISFSGAASCLPTPALLQGHTTQYITYTNRIWCSLTCAKHIFLLTLDVCSPVHKHVTWLADYITQFRPPM